MKLNELKDLLEQLQVSPLKRYGQNFLIDGTFVNKIIFYINSHENKLPLVEIGPGLGALSLELRNFYDIFAIEIDRKYAAYLSSLKLPRLTVFQGNALKFDFSYQCSVVSSMPYYISTELIEHLVIHSDHVNQAFLLAQREFVDKLFGIPGQDTYGPLAILIAWAGSVIRLFDVPYQAFFPEPGVVSSFFHISFHSQHSRETNYAFFLFIKKIFNNRRKTILNNLEHVVGDRLRAEDILHSLSIPLQLRPDDLTPDQFIAIFKSI